MNEDGFHWLRERGEGARPILMCQSQNLEALKNERNRPIIVSRISKKEKVRATTTRLPGATSRQMFILDWPGLRDPVVRSLNLTAVIVLLGAVEGAVKTWFQLSSSQQI